MTTYNCILNTVNNYLIIRDFIFRLKENVKFIHSYLQTNQVNDFLIASVKLFNFLKYEEFFTSFILPEDLKRLVEWQ